MVDHAHVGRFCLHGEGMGGTLGLGTMRVILDDIPLEVEVGTASEAIEAAVAVARERGRVLVEALCDGRPAGDEHLVGGSPGAVCSEVRCRSEDPGQLIRGALLDAAAELESMIPDQRAACEKLWVGRTAEAIDDLKGILARWQLARDAIEQCALAASVPLDAIGAPGGDSASALVSLLAGDLERARADISAGRMVEVADLLGTDLCERAASWVAMLRWFAGRIETPGEVAP